LRSLVHVDVRLFEYPANYDMHDKARRLRFATSAQIGKALEMRDPPGRMPAAHRTIRAYSEHSLRVLGIERITTIGAPAARAHIQHIFFLRFSPHSSPRVKPKPTIGSLTSDARRNANAHTFCTFMLPRLVREWTEPTPNEPDGGGETDDRSSILL